jgi:hypothetical protein
VGWGVSGRRGRLSAVHKCIPSGWGIGVLDWCLISRAVGGWNWEFDMGGYNSSCGRWGVGVLYKLDCSVIDGRRCEGGREEGRYEAAVRLRLCLIARGGRYRESDPIRVCKLIVGWFGSWVGRVWHNSVVRVRVDYVPSLPPRVKPCGTIPAAIACEARAKGNLESLLSVCCIGSM